MLERGKKYSILVTGASGLVGKSITQKLLEKNYSVLGIGKRGDPGISSPDFTFLKIDLTKAKKIEEIIGIGENCFSHVVHCAAIIPSVNTTEIDSAQANVRIDNLILDYLIRHEKSSLIYISTTGFYCTKNNQKPINEDGVINLESPYYVAKYNSEKEILKLKNSKTILRISSPYGPSQKTENVLKFFITKTIKGENISYYGEGTRKQDFIHCDDIANAAIKCIQQKPKSDILNIGSSVPISMKDLAYLVKSVYPYTDTKIISKPTNNESNETYYGNFDTMRARTELQWNPSYTLKQGIEEWIKTLVKK